MASRGGRKNKGNIGESVHTQRLGEQYGSDQGGIVITVIF